MARATGTTVPAVCMGFLLGLFGIAPLAAQTVYTYQGVPVGGQIRAAAEVVASGPSDPAASVEATAAEYLAIEADDAAEWATADPGNGNEVFTRCDMLVAEPRAAVTQIDFTFVGYTDRSGGPPGKLIPHQIWVLTAGTNPAVAANWTLAGTMSIAEGTVTTFSASVTTGVANYIDATTSAIRWGIYASESSSPTHIDALSMTVTAPRGVALSPRGVIGYGVRDVASGATAPQPVTITNSGAGTLTITSVGLTGADAGQFVVQSDSGQTSLSPGQTRTLQLAFDPSSSGVKTSALQVVTNAAAEPAAKIILTGAGGKGEVGVAPPGPLDFGLWEINAGPTAPSQVVTITNTGNAPLNLSQVALFGGDAVDFTITAPATLGALAAGQSTTASVVFNPLTTGPKLTALRVTSNDAETPVVDVLLKGVAGKGEVSVASLGPINFGARELSAGATTSVAFTVSNAGTAALTVISVALIGADAGHFAITSPATPGVLLPFGFTTASVAFDPSANGLRTATLRVTTTDLETPIVDIVLNGTGYTATPSPTPSATPTPSALNCYTTDGIVPGGPVAISVADVNDFPYNGAGSLNSTAAVGARDYLALAAVDGAELVTADPGNQDEIFLQMDMIVVEPIAALTNVDLVFRGYTEISGGPPGQTVIHDLYVLRTGTDPLVMSNWVLLASLSIVEGTATTLTGSITSNFANYIDAATGAIRWGVYTQQSSESMHVDAVNIKATATLDFDVSPRGLIAYGYQDINDGPTAGKVITITNTAAATLNLTSVSLIDADAAQFAIQADTAQLSLAQNQTRSVTVAFDPSTTGQKSARLRILSNAPNQPTFDVRLTGAGGKREISVSPAGLAAFGSREINLGPTLAPQNVTITSSGTGPLSVALPTLSGANVADFPATMPVAPAALYPGETLTVVLDFDPTAIGARAATLTIPSNDLETPLVNLSLTGTGTKAEISLSPAGPVDFGSRDVNAGATASIPFTLSNIGNGPLNVTAISVVGADAAHFLITNAPALGLLGAGGSTTINVAFDPTTQGVKLASLQVVSNDQESPIAGAGLRGDGTGTPASPTPSLTPSPSATAATATPTPSCTCTPVNAAADWDRYE